MPHLPDKSSKAGIAIRIADCVAPLYWSRRLFHAAVRSEDCFYIRSRCGITENFIPKRLNGTAN
jgi:hypothetical protein